jgi:hypothetical protein
MVSWRRRDGFLSGCGSDGERRRPFIAGGSLGRGGEEAREAVEKAREQARECERRRRTNQAHHS